MPLFTWSSTYELGIPAMDRQHLTLVEAINELHEAMHAGQDREVVQRTIHKLISYTKIHFESEEQLLTAKGFPSYTEHRMEHHAFVKRVLDFHNQFMDGRVVLSAEVMQFLKDWLASHILVEDRRYAVWMKERGMLGVSGG
jgi:hemerythrin